jgi:hypothetical protein
MSFSQDSNGRHMAWTFAMQRVRRWSCRNDEEPTARVPGSRRMVHPTHGSPGRSARRRAASQLKFWKLGATGVPESDRRAGADPGPSAGEPLHILSSLELGDRSAVRSHEAGARVGVGVVVATVVAGKATPSTLQLLSVGHVLGCDSSGCRPTLT